jgi:hypothetical protein
VYPHEWLCLVMVRSKSRISDEVGGLPVTRLELPSYLRAISRLPVQKSLGSDDGRKPLQPLSAQLLSFGCQPAALVVVESGLLIQLLSQDLHLFPEILDDELLVAVEPAGKTEK